MTTVSALILLTQNAIAYEPPIGIPDPGGDNPKTGVSYGWGDNHPIETKAPQPPVNWNEEQTGYYYINPDHSGATDINNTHGNPTKPRVTIPRTVPAGSYVEMAGNYDGEMEVNYRCTITEPCWIRGKSTTERPNITGKLSVANSSYLFIENLSFDGGTGSALPITRSTDHVVVRNNLFTNRAQPIRSATQYGNASAIGIVAKGSEGIISNVVIYNNDFDKLGAYDLSPDDPRYEDGRADPDFHAVVPSMWGGNSSNSLSNVWILNNRCSDISGDCVQANAGNWSESWKYLHHIYIGKNVAKAGRQVGFGIKQASDVIISQNVTFGERTSTSGNAGGGIGYQYGKQNLWIIFNEIYDSTFGIRQSDTGTMYDANGQVVYNDAFILGNLIYDINQQQDGYDPDNGWHQGTAIALWHGAMNRFIVDNTIYGTLDGLNGIYRGSISLSGNIISDIGEQEGNRFFSVSHPGRHNLVDMDYNLFFDETRQSYYSWQTKNGVAASSIATAEDISVETTYCQEFCEFSDPLFMNPTRDPQTRDFRLQVGSPAIGANIKHPVYDHFEALYGLSIYKDFNGNDRHPTNPSLGAFEYVDDADAFDPEKLQVKIKYPTKNPVYTYNYSTNSIQFGGHASYEEETITVDWVLAQCQDDCTEEVADGVGEVQITGSTETWRVSEFPINNWHVNNQPLFSGRNVLITTAIHPNGEKKVTSLIIEPDHTVPVDEEAPVIQISSPVAANGAVIQHHQQSITLSGNASDNVALRNITWSCTSGCTSQGTIDASSSPWELVVNDLKGGLNRILFEAEDISGNTASLTVSIQVDVTPPVVTLNTVTVSLSGSVSDNVAVESVTWSCQTGCPVSSGNASVEGNDWRINQLSLSSNKSTIRVEAVDAAGNSSVETLVITR